VLHNINYILVKNCRFWETYLYFSTNPTKPSHFNHHHRLFLVGLLRSLDWTDLIMLIGLF